MNTTATTTHEGEHLPGAADASGVTVPPQQRTRTRLVVLALILGLWLLPWWTAQLENGDTVVVSGAVVGGALAVTSLLALFGLAITARLSRRIRGIRGGAALVDAGVAALATALLLLEHPWISAGEIREAWSAIFAPLGLLALLDACLIRWHKGHGPEVAAIRAGAAAFAAGTLIIHGSWIPATIALQLCVSPLLLLKARQPRRARQALELVVFASALVHAFAPFVQRNLDPIGRMTGSYYIPFLAWALLISFVTLLSLDGIVRPEDEYATSDPA